MLNRLNPRVAALEAIAALAIIVGPTKVLAQGPTPPEMGRFSPPERTDVVDMFTGDFRYSVPLMELPGPHGGYPITLSYSSGITADQEATWVGLGWNLNPGS